MVKAFITLAAVFFLTAIGFGQHTESTYASATIVNPVTAQKVSDIVYTFERINDWATGPTFMKRGPLPNIIPAKRQWVIERKSEAILLLESANNVLYDIQVSPTIFIPHITNSIQFRPRILTVRPAVKKGFEEVSIGADIDFEMAKVTLNNYQANFVVMINYN